MPAILTKLLLLCLLATGTLSAKSPLPVPKLEDLIQPWIFVRASEASILFIDEDFKGIEPYGHLAKSKSGSHIWLEHDGKQTQFWNVLSSAREAKQFVLILQPLDQPDAPTSRLVIYPYWDIDHCLVFIRFDPSQEENPVRFATPYSFKNDLPYLEAEG